MDLAEQLPGDIGDDEVNIDTEYDWKINRSRYSENDINNMYRFIDNQKLLLSDDASNSCPIVLPQQLNKEQLLAYKIVEEYLKINKQLLMIILGTWNRQIIYYLFNFSFAERFSLSFSSNW